MSNSKRRSLEKVDEGVILSWNFNSELMNKKALWLLLVGSLLMALPLSINSFFVIPEDAADFIKGFGVALMIASVFKSRGLAKG